MWKELLSCSWRIFTNSIYESTKNFRNNVLFYFEWVSVFNNIYIVLKKTRKFFGKIEDSYVQNLWKHVTNITSVSK